MTYLWNVWTYRDIFLGLEDILVALQGCCSACYAVLLEGWVLASYRLQLARSSKNTGGSREPTSKEDLTISYLHS